VNRFYVNALCGAFVLSPLPAVAEDVANPCVAVSDDAARLQCYDARFGRAAQPDAGSAAAPAEPPAQPKPAEVAGAPTPDLVAPLPVGLSLSKIWELEPQDKGATFRLRLYKLNYLLPVQYSTSVNVAPHSPAAGHAVDSDLPIQSTEAKFQLSFKLKAWDNIIGDNGSLWFAYTQLSDWQVYNSRASAPFRSTDYEPEAILSFRLDQKVLGWRWRLINFGVVHQSNGDSLPLSRSWNRAYAQFGLERGDFSVLLRPWYRLPETRHQDDNPDIGQFLGSGDARVAYTHAGFSYSLLSRYSFSGHRGWLQADWAFPLRDALKGYLQVANGYGETLLDYNHSQTTIGVGILLLPWY
jgi:phospholipase A1